MRSRSGLAAILFVLRQLAKHRDLWAGEVVATFAGDEVCGLAPYNTGGADEYVDVAELLAVGDILALTAFDFLNAT